MTTPTFGLFCNPESRRVEGFDAAVDRSPGQRTVLVPWFAVLDDRDWEDALRPPPRFLRLESPDRNWRVEQQLLAWGAVEDDTEVQCGWRRLTTEAVARMEHDPGCIPPQRQWFLGWRRLLEKVGAWASHRGLSDRWLCPPEDVLCFFDKAACQRALESGGFPVPPALGLPRDFDELWELMRAAGRRRIFLKPCHSSSASGVVALESAGSRIQAFSTVEMVETGDSLRLYNQRRIRTHRDAKEVRRLVDAVCRERCLAQVWVPKAGLHGRAFDVRVMVIGGRARQMMVRLGRGPITNSQLLGGRGDTDALRAHMGDEAWSRMLATCERALATCFPRSLYAGFDVLVEPDFRTVRIIEINAFGEPAAARAA